MCVPDDQLSQTEYVKLMYCPKHQQFHLYVGKATIHLTPREVLLLGATIHRWWQDHPQQAQDIEPFIFAPQGQGGSDASQP